MGSATGRYHPRAPRYVLRPFDRTLLRFKSPSTKGATFAANVVDLSESGLSFELFEGDRPEPNELLKVEFAVPGLRQIACFATVTRIETNLESGPESLESRGVRIAIRFHGLPPAHQQALQTGLSERSHAKAGADSSETLHAPPLGLLLRFAFATAALISTFVLMTSGYG